MGEEITLENQCFLHTGVDKVTRTEELSKSFSSATPQTDPPSFLLEDTVSLCPLSQDACPFTSLPGSTHGDGCVLYCFSALESTCPRFPLLYRRYQGACSLPFPCGCAVSSDSTDVCSYHPGRSGFCCSVHLLHPHSSVIVLICRIYIAKPNLPLSSLRLGSLELDFPPACGLAAGDLGWFLCHSRLIFSPFFSFLIQKGRTIQVFPCEIRNI